MIANLKPYPSMKDSGVEWLRDVPGHWDTSKIKGLARPGYKTFVDGDWIESPYITTDGIRLIQTGNIGTGEYREKGFRYISEETFTNFCCTEIKPGDILICRLGEPVSRACIAPQLGKRMITSVDVCILKARENIHAKFLVYSMSSWPYLDWVGSLVRGSTRDRVSRSMLGSFLLPLPPLAEQVAIVRFLDHADRRILRYIRAKQKLVKLLEKQKQAIIHQAVTGQIDVRTGRPYPAYKDSGVEWLGAVPAHWEVRRNGRLFVQRNETGFPELPILEVSLNTGVRIRDFENSDRKQIMAVRTEYKRAAKGDIAYNMMRMWQGAVGMVPVDGLVSPAYVVARPLKGTESRYFSNIFRTKAYMAEVDKYSRGIVRDRNRLYWEDFKQIPTPYPPPDEQGRIVQYLDKTTVYVDTAIVRADRQSELLQEYRTRLIADVVTGKLDVREAAARLPEVDPLADEFDALTTQATETGMMAQEDATELP